MFIKKGIIFAVLAALLYALSTPFSKLLLDDIPPILLAALLYLGAGIGMFFVWIIKRKTKFYSKEQRLTKEDLPYTFAMIMLDIAAPILLLVGLSMTTAESVSLLNNFETAATAVIALCIFKEKINLKLWIAIGLITVASILLSLGDVANFEIKTGTLFVLGATICWGFENNCTRKLSNKDTYQIVVIKGIFSGLGSFIRKWV